MGRKIAHTAKNHMATIRHANKSLCLKVLNIEIHRLQRRLQELEVAKQLVQANGLCRECGIALRESDVESGECVEHQYARK